MQDNLNANLNKDELKSRLEKMAEENPNPQISYQEIFSPAFMQKYTNFANIDFFIQNLKLKNFTELEKMNPATLDSFIQKETHFKTWGEMQQAAVNNYMTSLF